MFSYVAIYSNQDFTMLASCRSGTIKMELERRWKWDSSCCWSKSVRHTCVLAQVNDYAYVHCTYVILCSASDVHVKDDVECDNVVHAHPGHGLRLQTCLPVAKISSIFCSILPDLHSA